MYRNFLILLLLMNCSVINAQESGKGEAIKAYFVFELTDPVFCRMQGTDVTAQNLDYFGTGNFKVLIDGYNNESFFENGHKLEFVSKMSVMANGLMVQSIRYNEVLNGEKRVPKIFSSHPDFEISRDMSTVLILQPFALEQLFRYSNDEKFPGLNAVKKEVKGIYNKIDISKLAEFIREENKLLSKYISMDTF